MKPTENEYRVTRPQMYKLGCPGWGDVSARQGYYYFAETQDAAFKQAAKDFPGERLDVQLAHRGAEMKAPETISFAFDLTVSTTFKDLASSTEQTAKLIKTLLESHPDLHHVTVKVYRG